MSRSLLGPADVGDDRLLAMVGALLGHEPQSLDLLDCTVEPVSYDLPAITTAGRYWVAGRVATPDGTEPFRLFVKHIQAWSRSPMFDGVPEEIRELAVAGVPWRTEALVYRSDLATRLPDGFRMARSFGVEDLDELSAAVWLEELPPAQWPWGVERFRRAAYLLGRLAGSPQVAPLAGIGAHEWSVQVYLEGRLRHQVLPMLEDDDLWRHPLVAGAFDSQLRDRMRSAAERIPEYVAELDASPHLTGHGDACPNNLLGVPDDPESFVLIDFGFWKHLPVAFDLGQLLVGDVQIGRQPAAALAETEAAILTSYVLGLRDEGCEIPEDVVRRAHALQVLVFSGISSLPDQHLDSRPTASLHALAAERAALARFSLDLVESTS